MQEEMLKRLHAPKLGPCVCSQVRRLARQLSSLYDTLLSPEDLTITQYSLLANIERAGQLRPHGPSPEGRMADQKKPYPPALLRKNGTYLCLSFALTSSKASHPITKKPSVK